MQFRLHYRGHLKANGSPAEKHLLRQRFHEQLKLLWQQLPLSCFSGFHQIPPPAGRVSLVRTVAGFSFVPLVAQQIHLIAELKILLLRPEPPGQIVTQCGDIDNRLKTLFDSLKVPELNALPNSATPGGGETPFFCLLEDDNLITSVSIETDRLLEPVTNASEVELIIHVNTRQLHVTWATIGLA